MTAVQKVYEWLEDGNSITGKQISDLVRENRDKHYRQVKLYERFKGTDKGVPILTRTFPVETASKVNNKLANDFFSDIVNTKTGYFMGNPVTYKYTEQDEDGSLIETTDADVLLQGFLKKNQVADLDSESAKMAAICGFAARLCYVNTEGTVSMLNVPPWETIFISDELGITDAPYAIRYYVVERGDKKYVKAEFYDEETITFFVREGGIDENVDTEFQLDSSEPANPQAHLMAGCPVICFPNNEELQGDCEKVLTLIDGYDKTLSDVNSEIEQFRLAYLAFYGSSPSDDELARLRQTGVIGFPDKDDRAEYITKNLNDVTVQNHLMKLEENIIYFAQSVRFTDEAFGNASGVAMKFKLFCLESKCKTAERKFIKSLYRMFTVLSGYYDKRGISYDPWNFEFVFTRNFPLNLLDEAQSLATLKGLVSDETAYGQMSFIDDPAKEIEKVKAEQEEYIKAEAEINAAMGGENGMQDQGQGQETEEINSMDSNI